MKTFTTFLLLMFSIVISVFSQPDVQGYIAGPAENGSNRELSPACANGSLFGQSPVTGFNVKSVSNTSALFNGSLFRKYENFSGLAKPISAVRFWGEFLDTKVGSPMPFRIIFYDDQAGQPGNITASFDIMVRPQSVEGGGFGYPFEFHVKLPSAVNLSQGWLSIQGNVPDNCFFWGGSSANIGDWSLYTKDQGGLTMNPHNLFFCLEPVTLVPVSNYAIILGLGLIILSIFIMNRRKFS